MLFATLNKSMYIDFISRAVRHILHVFAAWKREQTALWISFQEVNFPVGSRESLIP